MDHQYGKQLNLTEILEMLSIYCQESGESNASISVILPKKARDRHNLLCDIKQRVVLIGELSESAHMANLKAFHFIGGVVNIYSDDEHEITLKEKPT